MHIVIMFLLYDELFVALLVGRPSSKYSYEAKIVIMF